MKLTEGSWTLYLFLSHFLALLKFVPSDTQLAQSLGKLPHLILSRLPWQ